jgi:hypothetical protein
MATPKTKPPKKPVITIKPTRLKKDDRIALRNYARSLIVCPDRQVKMQTAEDALRDYVAVLLNAHYPMMDMVVLQKYGQTHTTERFTLADPDNDTIEVSVAWNASLFTQYGRGRTRDSRVRREIKEGSYAHTAIESKYNHALRVPSVKGRPVPRGVTELRLATSERAELIDLFYAWKDALEAHYIEFVKKLDDYTALIAQTQTWEDLEAVWPECINIKAQCVEPTTIVKYDPELPKRIKRDVEMRKATGYAAGPATPMEAE